LNKHEFRRWSEQELIKKYNNFGNEDEIIDYLSELKYQDYVLNEKEAEYILEGEYKILEETRTINGELYTIVVTHFNDGNYPDGMNCNIIIFKEE